MKYAVISDIHGNTNAFKAALLDAKKRGCGKVVCLGDLTGTIPSGVSNWQWRDWMFA